MSVVRTTRRSTVLVALAALLGGLWAAPTVAATSSGPGPDVRVTFQSSLQLSVNAAACSTPSACYLVGQGGASTTSSRGSGVILFSSNGGRSWTTVFSLDRLSASFSSVTCTAAGICTAAASWTISVRQHDGLSQDDGTSELAVGAGPSWRLVPLPAGTAWAALEAASCSSRTTCVADLDGAWVSTDTSGAKWSLVRVDSPVVPESLTCDTSQDCVESGAAATKEWTTASGIVRDFETTDGGRKWTPLAVPQGFDRFPDTTGVSGTSAGITCSGAATCVAYSEWYDWSENAHLHSWVTFDDGGRWQRAQLGTNPAAMWCPTALDCFGVGPDANAYWGDGAESPEVYSTDGGATWQLAATDVNTTPQSVTCTGSTCIVTNEESPGVLVSHDGGVRWQSASGLSGSRTQQYAACATARDCFVLADPVGSLEDYLLYASHDAGSTWALALRIDSSSSNVGLTCDHARCFVNVGDTEWTTTDAGGTWSSRRLPSRLELSQLDDSGGTPISCAGRTCVRIVVADDHLEVSHDAGATYAEQDVGFSTSFLASVDCVTASTCYVVGSEGSSHATLLARTEDAGRRWAVLGSVGEQNQVSQIACASALRCIAVTWPQTTEGSENENVYWTSDAGERWAVLVPGGLGARAPVGVSCEPDGVCVLSSQSPDYSAEVLRATFP